MARLTFKSPGVSTREIDLSQPSGVEPSGVPAGVVGAAVRGPAFVPVTVATFDDFINKFGNTDGEKFGPLAMSEWLRNASAGTYVRILGVGDGKKRTSSGANAGKVTNAGFVVGAQQVQANGNVGNNTYATTAGDPLGRTYVLGTFVSESAGSTFLSDAGIGTNSVARPIVRGIIMTPSGVALTLNGSHLTAAQNLPSTSASPGVLSGSSYGDINRANSKQEFIMLLNGHTVSDDATNIITASFDPKDPNYFVKQLNTDPMLIEKMGHCLHSYYDVYPIQATITGSGLLSSDIGDTANIAKLSVFCLAGSAGRNTGTAPDADSPGCPNFENFEDRFRTAKSPFVISQKFGGLNKNLFRVHALDDGRAGSDTFKITIQNIQASTNENNPYGSFDLVVRYFADSDEEPVELERFSGLDLNPSSDNFIARRIGDMHAYYDFDKSNGSQKLVIDGTYPNISSYIRIELSDSLRNNALDASSLPVGFRGIQHLVTSGTLQGGGSMLTGSLRASGVLAIAPKHIVQLPVPLRESVAKGVVPKKRVESKLTWGVQFSQKDSLDEPNRHQKLNDSIRSFGLYHPNYHTTYQNLVVSNNEGVPDLDGSVLDADRFNNNIFTLERVAVITGSTNRPDVKQWGAATYKRNGVAPSSLTDIDGNSSTKVRFINPSTDFSHLPTRKYLKFTFPLEGGFDGVNIFDADKSSFADNAIRREMTDSSNQGGTSGPTVAAYRKGIQVMEEKSDVDIQLLAVPGIRHTAVTDYALESVERRFDAMLIMDVEEKDTYNAYVTSSATQVINVSNTTDTFASRNIDSSFGAAYFPDVTMVDPALGSVVKVPPSVPVLGAFAYNDAVAHPWFAPAGFNRGALTTTQETWVKLNRSNLDDLYEVDINPLTAFPSSPGVVVFGQKTLLAGQSALDRVNVRRLLINIRRQVRDIANTLLFEPNREATLNRFSNAVTPILGRIQQQQGLDRFKVQIDTTTTTQADVENNTIRGKIYLQPTKSLEFVSLDFVVTNGGAEI